MIHNKKFCFLKACGIFRGAIQIYFMRLPFSPVITRDAVNVSIFSSVGQFVWRHHSQTFGAASELQTELIFFQFEAFLLLFLPILAQSRLLTVSTVPIFVTQGTVIFALG